MDTPCILWAGVLDRNGYGRQSRASKWHAAHRLAYQDAYGPIPADLTVDHLCFTKRCVNPAHLRLLSRAENSANQRSAYKTHCVNGHEFTPENTYIRPARNRAGQRDCRACIRVRVRRYQQRNGRAA